MTFFEVDHAERAAWQRRAVAELAAILHAHPDLPIIAWTVGAAGATLSGRVLGCPRPARTRQSFQAWREALMLTGRADADADALVDAVCTRLHATAQRGRVRVNLAATVFHDDDAFHDDHDDEHHDEIGGQR